jgi:hypothetical protein
LYTLSVKVKEKIQSLCEDDAELENDPNRLLEAMKEESFIEYVSIVCSKSLVDVI